MKNLRKTGDIFVDIGADKRRLRVEKRDGQQMRVNVEERSGTRGKLSSVFCDRDHASRNVTHVNHRRIIRYGDGPPPMHWALVTKV